MQLMIGSEGTLGIITEAILKLVPLPKITESLLVPFPSVEEGIRVVPQIIKSKASTTEMDECDVVVPRNKVADFIEYTHELAKESGVRIPYGKAS